MDEFKPEDELKPDPSDRRTGRSRHLLNVLSVLNVANRRSILMILNLMTLTIAVRLVRKKSVMRNRKSKQKLTNPKMKPWMKSA
ncbi:DamX protein [Escherichia coli]|uniref:DamX protein n=1 Tax=Escherichia coli TaxID=562 RepID=A0A376TSL7_ECOLX|nr:DamX protein [Escherichia coli]